MHCFQIQVNSLIKLGRPFPIASRGGFFSSDIAVSPKKSIYPGVTVPSLQIKADKNLCLLRSYLTWEWKLIVSIHLEAHRQMLAGVGGFFDRWKRGFYMQQQTWALPTQRFRSKQFNLATSCLWRMNQFLSRKCPTLLKTMYLGQSVLESCERQRDATQKAMTLGGAHNPSQWASLALMHLQRTFKRNLKMRRILGQRCHFYHPSQSPLCCARFIWCWLETGTWDGHTRNNTEVNERNFFTFHLADAFIHYNKCI